MAKCPCGSENDYKKCCALYIKDRVSAPTAEALMRARYTAYVQKEVDFIIDTHDSETRKDVSKESVSEWANDSKWYGLTILKTTGGGKDDKSGSVEFIAEYKQGGTKFKHHEHSDFVKKKGKWYFHDSRMINEPVVNENKVGRNDPCPCGSGKKYKKCCG
ncbi:MAG: YchJ family protein [Spirochaetaceae bacterium]|nr:YchJ family protein [Spirochaetaceae bacterium]